MHCWMTQCLITQCWSLTQCQIMQCWMTASVGMSNYLMLNYAMSNDTMLIYAMSNYVTLKYQVSKYSMSNCEMSNDKTCQGPLRLLRLSTDQHRVLPPKLVESFVHSIKTLIQNSWDQSRSRGLVDKAEDSWLRGPGFKPPLWRPFFTDH